MSSTATKSRLPSLDGLRAISIVLVIGSHLLLFSSAKLNFFPAVQIFDGALGVRIFFVISGFIITHLFILEQDTRGEISISRFYLRRLLRLYPVNLAFVLTLFLLTRWTPLTMTNCQYLTALTYIKNFACGSWMDGHLWSLAVEEQFYLAWPLAFSLLRGRVLYCVALLFVAIAPVSRALEYRSGMRLYALPTSNSDALMLGCLLALLFRDKADLIKRLAHWRPHIGRTMALLLMYLPIALSSRFLFARFTVTLGPMLQAACASYLILSLVLVREGLSFFLLNSRLMRGIGLISYSLYIWQQPLLFAPPGFFGSNLKWLSYFPQDVLLAFGCATLSYFVLERPLVKLRANLHPRRTYGGGHNARQDSVNEPLTPAASSLADGESCISS